MLKKLLVILLLLLLTTVSFSKKKVTEPLSEKEKEIKYYEDQMYYKSFRLGALNKLLNIFKEEKNYIEAEKYYKIVIEMGSKEGGREENEQVAAGLMISFYKSIGEEERLEKFLKELIEIDRLIIKNTGYPRYSNSMIELGELYEKQEKYDKAFEYYDKAYLKSHGSRGYEELRKLEKKIKTQEQIESYTKAGEAGDGEAYYQLALIYKEKNDLEKMLFYYQKGADNGSIKSIREFCYWSYARKDYKLVEKYYKMAIANKNDDALIYLSKLYSKQGKSELAYKYYSEVMNKHSPEWIGYRIIEFEKRPWILLE